MVVPATLGSAVRTVVLPRGIPSRLSRVVFLTMRQLFRLRARAAAPYEVRDRVMALYAPVSLLALLLTWLTILVGAYTLMFWGLGGKSFREAFVVSGSSVFTLGFARPGGAGPTALAFSEAAFGLILLTLLIAYLPSIYGVFSRRETAVAMLEVRAGSPPTGVELLERFWRIDAMDRLTEQWEQWEAWFVDVAESHTSFPAVVFFRSPLPEHSWVTAAGAVLDAAALSESALATPHDPSAALCIRAGYLALGRVAAFFRIPFDPKPKPDDPISIDREEFDHVFDRMLANGLPVKPDRDQAWRDFAGWRVNYDRVLIALAGLTMAPYAPWASDRSLMDWRPRAVFGRTPRSARRDEASRAG